MLGGRRTPEATSPRPWMQQSFLPDETTLAIPALANPNALAAPSPLGRATRQRLSRPFSSHPTCSPCVTGVASPKAPSTQLPGASHGAHFCSAHLQWMSSSVQSAKAGSASSAPSSIPSPRAPFSRASRSRPQLHRWPERATLPSSSGRSSRESRRTRSGCEPTAAVGVAAGTPAVQCRRRCRGLPCKGSGLSADSDMNVTIQSQRN